MLFMYVQYAKAMKGALRGDWLWYDEAFRWNKERSGCPWTILRIDLVLQSVQRASREQTQVMHQAVGSTNERSLSSA